MLIYRIVSPKYSSQLKGSRRAARWNSDDVEIVYTASSRSLACLENVVNRDQFGLMQSFDLMIISCPSTIKMKTIPPKSLPSNWRDYDQKIFTQFIGDEWIRKNQTAILKVPSAIIEEEANYLLNPIHEDFKLIKIVKTEPFSFDVRIKQPPLNLPR